MLKGSKLNFMIANTMFLAFIVASNTQQGQADLTVVIFFGLFRALKSNEREELFV